MKKKTKTPDISQVHFSLLINQSQSWYEKKKKESVCNAGDPGSIPGLGIFVGEGIAYPLQYSWASFVAQLVKNLPAQGWDDLRE